jgi:hypothetical protein
MVELGGPSGRDVSILIVRFFGLIARKCDTDFLYLFSIGTTCWDCRVRVPDMSEDFQDDLNDPIDDELDAAMMGAAELVERAKRIGMTKLELPLGDQSDRWKVIIQKEEIAEYPGSGHELRASGDHDGKLG